MPQIHRLENYIFNVYFIVRWELSKVRLGSLENWVISRSWYKLVPLLIYVILEATFTGSDEIAVNYVSLGVLRINWGTRKIKESVPRMRP